VAAPRGRGPDRRASAERLIAVTREIQQLQQALAICAVFALLGSRWTQIHASEHDAATHADVPAQQEIVQHGRMRELAEVLERSRDSDGGDLMRL
jgi:hypothetical protein